MEHYRDIGWVIYCVTKITIVPGSYVFTAIAEWTSNTYVISFSLAPDI